MLLGNAEFLTKLKSLLDSQVTSGSVFITQKRYTFEDGNQEAGSGGEDAEMPAASTSSEAAAGATGDNKQYPCIIKATNGKHAGNRAKKVKISTLVQPGDTDSFTLAYGTLLKAHFSLAMRKKQKKRKEKDAAKAKAGVAGSGGLAAADAGKRRRKLTRGGLPKIRGARRGAGHASRQQTQRARAKAAKRILVKKQSRAKDAAILAKLPQPPTNV